jgi:fatty-acyl-CoA synthase
MSVAEAATLADVIRVQAQTRGDSIALVFEGRETSYRSLDRNANRVANGLIALGVKPNERIAYLGKNSDLFIELLAGAVKAKVVTAPVNWRLAGPEIAFIVDDAKAQVLFVGPEFVDLVRSLRPQMPGVRIVMTMEGGATEWQDFTAWRDAQSERDPNLTMTKDDVAIQLYTSGTTGKPKGAMLSHQNFLSLLRIGGTDENPDWNVWTADDVSLVAMPVFHIGSISSGTTASANCSWCRQRCSSSCGSRVRGRWISASCATSCMAHRRSPPPCSRNASAYSAAASCRCTG